MHTTDSLKLFDTATIALSSMVRKFLNTTCEDYVTQELPRETAVQGRQNAAKVKKGQHIPETSSGPKRKTLNLQTYKYHALGDYANTIREWGTKDNYTMQLVFSFIVEGFVLIGDVG